MVYLLLGKKDGDVLSAAFERAAWRSGMIAHTRT
jgi:hypothetical protein